MQKDIEAFADFLVHLCLLVITGNRTNLRGDIAGQIEHHFVNIAPTPAFRRIIGFDDRVLRHAEMFCGVSIWRLVAATDMTAAAADTQMQPRIAQFQAFFTPRRARKNIADSRNIFAMYCRNHVLLRLLYPATPAA
jgi:hypothetical protein